ncbi:HpcH/HpaI aldolase family protein [Salinarimonas ramus]|uniref:Aldolase n=1 Tax=Salinarimonas ramus TaxID=690164 RepID=A0A917QH33_9HYPH|nr:aldolase/citrate lyase family protein [Salinarimonas ramus]GGK50960.1 aldolase [Salinarimonas ramus]
MRIGLCACTVRSLEILAIARHAGYDFLLVDMEHGMFSMAETAALCLAGREAGYPVHVRAPGPSSALVSRIVDCGAAGLVVPHVESAEVVRALVAKVRFAPLGARSVPPPVAATGFVPMPTAALREAVGRGPELLVMIESARGLSAVDEIAAVAGIDGLVVGTNDLASSLDLHTRPDAPELAAAIETIAGAAARRGLVFGAMGMPESMIRTRSDALGTSWLVATNDVNLIFEAGRELLARLRAPGASTTHETRERDR